jgi:sugar lactone lactonase YvrE
VTVFANPVGWQVVAASGCELGEHPLWDDRDDSLVWVDILGGAVYRMLTSGAISTARLGGIVGAVGLRVDGGLVASVDHGFEFLDACGRVDRDPVPVTIDTGTRFNDAACDPSGGFLAGTAAIDGRSESGKLFRLAANGCVSVVLEELVESNGLAWSPDGEIFYFVDSGQACIRRYDYDPVAGAIGARRSDLAIFAAAEGIPDGLTVDCSGAIWVAMWQGGAVRRYAPDGRLIDCLPTPVSQPTCPTFGGPGLDRLFITSAREGLSEAVRATEPWAGHVLSIRPSIGGVAGRLAHRFG